MKTVGILGLGSIGKRHADNLLEMGHKVVAYDPYFVGFTKAQGDIVLCQTAKELYEVEKDALVIASPTPFHVEHIFDRDLFVPDNELLFVEKPIGGSWEDYKALQRMGAGDITVGNNLRFNGCVQKAKEWLPDVPIWANFTVAQYNARPQYLRDGVTLNWGAHEMDLALYLLGPAEVIGASIDKEDTIADILLLHNNGCRTTLHFDYLTKSEVRTFLIQGQDKIIACNLLLDAIGTDAGDSYTWDKDFNETYVLEMKAFLDGDTGIAASGEDGLRCLKLLLDAKKMGGL